MHQTTASPLTLTIGLDIGDRITHFCILDDQRRVVRRGKFATTRDGFARELGKLSPQKVVLEAGSQSLWVSHLLREQGHNVHVVDPRRVHQLVKGDRKTDRRDAETLARLELGDGFLRRLLVVAAHHILGPFGKDSDLRRCGLRLCERGAKNGKKRAVCAVARKLAVLLRRLWVSGAPYEPLLNSAKLKIVAEEGAA